MPHPNLVIGHACMITRYMIFPVMIHVLVVMLIGCPKGATQIIRR